MRWQVWQSPAPESLPDRVWRVLATQFRMDVSQITTMRCVEKRGRFARRSVKFLRVFDPVAIPNADNVIREYDDLANHGEAVLFEGHMEGDGYVRLVDKRQQKVVLPATAAAALAG